METTKKKQPRQAANRLSDAALRLALAGACFVLSPWQARSAQASASAPAATVPLPMPRPDIASGSRPDGPMPLPQPRPSIAVPASTASPLGSSSNSSAGNSEDSVELPMFDPASVDRMESALARYKTMQSALPPGLIPIRAKLTPEVIGLIAARLVAEGFLPATYRPGDKFDADMRQALRAWQRDYGLSETGVLDQPTRVELNIPISVRIRQLEASIARQGVPSSIWKILRHRQCSGRASPDRRWRHCEGRASRNRGQGHPQDA